jgi:hypothetical protein
MAGGAGDARTHILLSTGTPGDSQFSPGFPFSLLSVLKSI